MRNLKYFISRNALNQMYMSFLLPVVEYASVVLDGCSEQDLQSLVVTEMHFLLQKNLKNIMHGRVKMYVMR